MQTVGRAVPVSKRGYEGLILDFDSDPQAMCLEAERTTPKVAHWEATLSEIDLKVRVLAEEAGRASDS